MAENGALSSARAQARAPARTLPDPRNIIFGGRHILPACKYLHQLQAGCGIHFVVSCRRVQNGGRGGFLRGNVASSCSSAVSWAATLVTPFSITIYMAAHRNLFRRASFYGASFRRQQTSDARRAREFNRRFSRMTVSPCSSFVGVSDGDRAMPTHSKLVVNDDVRSELGRRAGARAAPADARAGRRRAGRVTRRACLFQR